MTLMPAQQRSTGADITPTDVNVSQQSMGIGIDESFE